MKTISKIVVIISIYFSLISNTFASQNYMFVNFDLLINETSIGKKSLSKINELDKKNITKLNLYEEELNKIENEIKIKKNIISKEEYNIEVNKLKQKAKEYNNEKNLMVQNLNDLKKNELKLFLETINPIIQNYMDQNSIDIIFDKKSIFIGNKKLDLNKLLINKLNNKIK